jgi:asparagine synthase (glutamine-hydrolysing)
VGRILSEEIIHRPKEGFVQPVYSWMHSALKKLFIDYINMLPPCFFNADYIKDLIQRYINDDQQVNAKVWNLVCFSIWYQKYVL